MRFALISKRESLSALSIFFIESFRAQLVLHSFPTRRSSDLELLLDSVGGGAWPFLVGGVICLVDSDNERDSSLLNRCSITDRKSTRLNSSHPSISYAVFCLKKKNNSNPDGLAIPRPSSPLYR